jgi:hypothetical protein
MRALNKFAFELAVVIITAAITYTIAGHLCGWLAGSIHGGGPWMP